MISGSYLSNAAIKGASSAAAQCYTFHARTNQASYSSDPKLYNLIKFIDIIVVGASSGNLIQAIKDGHIPRFYDISPIIQNVDLADIFAKTSIGLVSESINIMGNSIMNAYDSLSSYIGDSSSSENHHDL